MSTTVVKAGSQYMRQSEVATMFGVVSNTVLNWERERGGVFVAAVGGGESRLKRGERRSRNHLVLYHRYQVELMQAVHHGDMSEEEALALWEGFRAKIGRGSWEPGTDVS